jgi:hypothetical protein
MLVNDVMHEWEGGVVKRTIAYLVRLLHSVDGRGIALIDERCVFILTKYHQVILIHSCRFRDMPSFGSRLRRFPPNFSQLQNLAARDHENSLLVSSARLILEISHM